MLIISTLFIFLTSWSDIVVGQVEGRHPISQWISTLELKLCVIIHKVPTKFKNKVNVAASYHLHLLLSNSHTCRFVKPWSAQLKCRIVLQVVVIILLKGKFKVRLLLHNNKSTTYNLHWKITMEEGSVVFVGLFFLVLKHYCCGKPMVKFVKKLQTLPWHFIVILSLF